MKLLDILKEVGEATAKPYKWEMESYIDEEDYKRYAFKTDSGLNYELEIDTWSIGGEDTTVVNLK